MKTPREALDILKNENVQQNNKWAALAYLLTFILDVMDVCDLDEEYDPNAKPHEKEEQEENGDGVGIMGLLIGVGAAVLLGTLLAAAIYCVGVYIFR